jgi:hypothetical protein
MVLEDGFNLGVEGRIDHRIAEQVADHTDAVGVG